MMKEQIREIPFFGNLAAQIYGKILEYQAIPFFFPGSNDYWEDRYAAGGTSGVGSYGKFAIFKAEVMNSFVAEHGVKSVIELGCGDGNQLELADYPEYTGYDVSETVIAICRERFSSDPKKKFKVMREYRGETAELSLSVDVIYHLVEDEVYHEYMCNLFDSASRYVIIYSSNKSGNTLHEWAHVKHRKFTRWIKDHLQGWTLLEHIPNKYPYKGHYKKGSFADFYIYEKSGITADS